MYGEGKLPRINETSAIMLLTGFDRGGMSAKCEFERGLDSHHRANGNGSGDKLSKGEYTT